jgi:thiamine-phosphate pyrophosphorylase
LHVVTDDEVLARPRFAAMAGSVLAAGGPAVTLHLRGHATSAGRLFGAAIGLGAAARDAGARLLVNDRVDIALAAGADGVQLGWRSLPVERVRGLIGPRLIGYSAHEAGEAAAAAAAGADFVLIGAIYETPSHPGRAAGAALVQAAAAAASVPLVAIGGVTPARVPELVSAGAAGVAVRSGVWDAADPSAAAVAFVRALGVT